MLTLTACASVPGTDPLQPAAPAAAAQSAILDSASYSSEDATFAKPYIDKDEWRDAPVRHRYVHGGFAGTETRFSFYFPPPAQYRGRFFQHVTPTPLHENLAQQLPAGGNNKIGYAADSGAYFVETNGGGAIDLTTGSIMLADPTITAYRANAAAAQFSRHVARQIYATGKRPYGYVYGGSGGAYRTIGSVENTQGVWDGAVPYVPGSLVAIPNMFTVRMQALRVLRGKFPRIVDALDEGGSGDAYAGLSQHEASVLREVEAMGFPMKTWFGHATMGLHGFAALYGRVKLADPTYFDDFWRRPGYLGHDRPELFARDRVRFSTTIAEAITAAEAARLGLSANPMRKDDAGNVDRAFRGPPEEAGRIVGFRLKGASQPDYFLGGELIVTSGAASGKRLMLNTFTGDVVMLGTVNPQVAASLAPGDSVTVDNSNFLAMETYHRHQVPGPDYPVWNQFRKADGTPLYPQRPRIIGPMFVQSTSGSQMTGKVDEKLIIAASLWDREAMPWQADWYRQRVEAYHGKKAGDQVRLYYTDRALHGDTDPAKMMEDPSRVVSYVPVLVQALRDLAAWVEQGIAPPAATQYRIGNGQVIVPADAAERRGIQPTVRLTANGGERAEVRVGEPVELVARVAVPPGTGRIVALDWDLDGSGTFSAPAKVTPGRSQATFRTVHRFEKPGTWFVSARAQSQRQGDPNTPYARIPALGRVRIVVR